MTPRHSIGAVLCLGAALNGCASAAPPAEHRHASHAHTTSQHRFEDAAAWAEHFDDPARDEWQRPDQVLAWLDPAPGATIVDLGAGTGYFTERLARAVPDGRVVAVDIEPDLLRHIEERMREAGLTNVETVLATAEDPRFAGPVDAVLVVNTYHHIEARTDYFERLSHRLAAGGQVTIVDFKMGELPVGPPDPHKLSRDEVTRELTAAGLRRCQEHALPYQYVLRFARDCGSD